MSFQHPYSPMRLLRWIVSLLILATGFLPTAAAAMFFGDVPETHPYAESIELLREREIVQGFVVPGERRVFWPDSSITRAEFTQMIVHALAPQTLIDECLTDSQALERYGLGMSFADVPADAWYAPAVCTAWSYRFVSGYGDGSFRPDRPITLAEGSKILSVAFALAPLEIPELTVLGTEWYKPYLHYMTTAGAIPGTAQDYAHLLTRGEVAEMLARLLKLPSDQPPETRIALDTEEVANPVTWTEMRNPTLGFALAYPNSWPTPHLMSRGTYDRTLSPRLPSLWKLFIGPEPVCVGRNTCLERDFSLTGFDRKLAAQAITELDDDQYVSIIEDETVNGTRTIFYEETTDCTARGAFLITPKRFLRFRMHCETTLHNPENAFMRLLGMLQVLDH